MAKARHPWKLGILVILVVLLSAGLTGCDTIMGLLGAPTATAGAAQAVGVGEKVSLDASSSTGKNNTYAWTLTVPDGSVTAKLSISTGAKVSFTPDIQGEYTISLTATNSLGTSTVSIVVTASMPDGFYAAPADLAVSIASGKVTLTWTAAADGLGIPPDSYKVYQATTATGTYSSVTTLDSDATDTSFVRSIGATATYYFKVKGIYGTIEGDLSPYIKATGTTFTVTAPAGFAAGTTTWNKVPLTWTAATGAAGYDIQRASTTGGTYSSVATGLTGTSYDDATGLTALTDYYYQIRSTASGTTSSWSTEISAKTAAQPTATAVPGTPTGLTAPTSSTTSNTLTVNWTAADATALWYDVAMSQDTGLTWTTISTQTDPGTAVSFVAKNLLASMSYTFRVRGHNSKGDGAWSTTVTGMTKAATAVTTVPSTAPYLQPGTITQSSIQVKWFGLSDATSYQVQYMGGSQITWADVAGVTDTTYLSAVQTGLVASTTYSFQIRAKNATGNGPWTTTPSSYMTSASVAGLTAPTGTIYVYFDSATSSSFRAAWYSVTNASYYVAYLSATDPAVTTWTSSQTVSSTEATFSGLTANTMYYVKVVAWNGAGSLFGSPSSTWTSATSTQNLPPTQPSGVNASNQTMNGINYANISWSPSYGWNGTMGNYYTIYRKGPYDYGVWQWAGQVDQYTTWFTDYNNYFSPGMSYSYMVKAVNVFTGGVTLTSAASSTVVYISPNGIAPVAYTYFSSYDSSVEVYWDYNSQVNYYTVEYSADNQVTWQTYSYSVYSTYIWLYPTSMQALSGGATNYYVRVTAWDYNYNSGSTVVYFTPVSSQTTTTVNIKVQ